MLIATPALASIGSITNFKGAGQIKRGSASIPANQNSGIEKMDIVSTNSQGKIKITFIDATTVNITENSRLVIDDFVFDSKNSSKGKLGLKVALGTIRYTSGALAHGNPSGINIRTPTATIAVRGTDFVMSVDETGESTVILVPNCYDDKDITKTEFDCSSGVIEVITAAGIVTLNKPFQATVVQNSFIPPSPPIKITTALKVMNNNIQISPLATDDGKSLIKFAKNAATKYANPSKAIADSNKDPTTNSNDSAEEAELAVQQKSSSQINDQKDTLIPKITVSGRVIYTNVSPTYVKQVQEGWAYARMSSDKNQVVAIWVDLKTDTQIISSQEGLIDFYDFVNAKYPTSGSGKATGNINIIQNGAVPPTNSGK